jgi:hypothetical protein
VALLEACLGFIRSWGLVVRAAPDRWIWSTTIGCVALLALIADTVSYLHMYLLVDLHGQAR